MTHFVSEFIRSFPDDIHIVLSYILTNRSSIPIVYLALTILRTVLMNRIQMTVSQQIIFVTMMFFISELIGRFIILPNANVT